MLINLYLNAHFFYSSEEEQNTEHKLDFKVIQLLISRLPKGQQVLKEVRMCLCLCKQCTNDSSKQWHTMHALNKIPH